MSGHNRLNAEDGRSLSICAGSTGLLLFIIGTALYSSANQKNWQDHFSELSSQCQSVLEPIKAAGHGCRSLLEHEGADSHE